MVRLLRLSLVLLVTCAGVVVAAPLVVGLSPSEQNAVDKPGRNGVILQLDRKSGCVWRVAEATGKRELDGPCKRTK